jgi:hypothetical protein
MSWQYGVRQGQFLSVAIPLASPQAGSPSEENVAKHHKIARTEWFSDPARKENRRRLRLLLWLRNILLMTQTPLVAVMQRGE